MIVAEIAKIEIVFVLRNLLHILYGEVCVDDAFNGTSLCINGIENNVAVVVECPQPVLPIEKRGGVVQRVTQLSHNRSCDIGFGNATRLRIRTYTINYQQYNK